MPKAERKRWAWPYDLKRLITRSGNLVCGCEFSARCFDTAAEGVRHRVILRPSPHRNFSACL
jgi:hypothetical protein